MEDAKNDEKQERLIKAIRLLQLLVSKDMHGEVRFKLEQGHIVNVEKETSTQW